jgi:hypothetical protein
MPTSIRLAIMLVGRDCICLPYHATLAAIRKSKPLPTASVHILSHISGNTHSAGAMTSPSTLYSQSQPKPGRRSRRAEEGEELEKKPKKVNSEVRKQQNRIASRNYRTSGPGVVGADANVWSMQEKSVNANSSTFRN